MAVSSLRRLRAIALGASLVSFLLLVVAFGWAWKPYEQAIVGIVCYISISWFRRVHQRLAAVEAAGSRS